MTPTPETPSLAELRRLRDGLQELTETSSYEVDVYRAYRGFRAGLDAANLGIVIAESLERENAELRAELRNILESAVPNQKEHPTMFAAWNRAKALLAKHTKEKR